MILRRWSRWAAVMLAMLALILGHAARAADFPNGVRDTLGPQFGPAAQQKAAAGLYQAARTRRHRRPALLEPDRDRCERTRSHAGRRRREPRLRRATGTGPVEPRHGDRPYRHFRCGQCHRRRLSKLHRLPRARDEASIDAAIATAAHDTLVAMFPSQAQSFDDLLAEDLNGINRPKAKAAGIAVGRQAAAAILALRANDGSQHPEDHMDIDYVPGIEPGDWRQDPVSRSPIALGAHWGTVTPFVLKSGDQFRAPAAAPRQRRVCRRLQRSGPPGRRWRRDRHATHGGTDRDRDLLGVRWNAEPVRAAAPVQPDRDADCRRGIAGHRRDGAVDGARQHRDGRRRHCDLGVEVLLRVLAAGDRDTRSR